MDGKGAFEAHPQAQELQKGPRRIGLIALRGLSKTRTDYLETIHMGRTNKARLVVCSKAIVKLECLVFVFFSRLDGCNQTLLLGGV